MPSHITLRLRPEHALQYAAMLHAMIQEQVPPSPTFQAMLTDLCDKLTEAMSEQLSTEEIERLTSK